MKPHYTAEVMERLAQALVKAGSSEQPVSNNDLYAAASALLQAAQTDRERTWQPIETAPKDGTYVILSDGICLPEIAAWHPEVPERVVYGNRHLARPEGWFNVTRARAQPTIWLPLPPAPGKDQK